ncbi:TPA: hypothetical protein HA297_02065 [Candidatus Woesearchaeota archaeon]|nr:hypothetical protein [Candidatus Woesearchaeota archaeon]
MGVQGQQQNKQPKKLQQASHPAPHPAPVQTSQAVTFSANDFKSLFSRLEPGFQWFKTYGPKYGFLLLILIPLLLSTWIRMQPEKLTSVEKFAEQRVQEQIRTVVAQDLIKNNPRVNQLSYRDFYRVVNEEAERKKEQLGVVYDQQLEKMTRELKEYYQDENGDMYLLSIDPYQYLRYTKNVLKNGHHGDEIRDGSWFDAHMRAPLGKPLNFSAYPYFNAYLYKFLKIFIPRWTVERTLAISQVLLMAFTLIIAYLLIRKFAGDFGALAGTVLLAIHPILVDRTVGGLADTDMLIIFFFLLSIGFFAWGLEATGKKRWIFLALSAIMIGIFTHVWTGWWLVAYLLTGAGVVSSIVLYGAQKIMKITKGGRNDASDTLKATGWFVMLMIVFVSLFRGKRFLEYLEILFTMPFYYIGNIKGAAVRSDSLWPNVYETVAELVDISVRDIIKELGGMIIILIFFAGVIMLIWFAMQQMKEPKEESKETKNQHRTGMFMAIVTLLWGVGMIYTAKQGGVRFVSMAVPPIALGFGLGVGLLMMIMLQQTKKIVPETSQRYRPTKILASVLFILLVGWLLGFVVVSPFCTGMCKTANRVAEYYTPLIDDGWYNALTKIKQESSPDAIINSWWDFGHWSKYYADRAVTFDGASQNTPQAYWMGRALITDNEKESVAILRMLNCGAQTGFELIENKTQNQIRAMQITNTILFQSNDQIRATLREKGFEEPVIEKVMERMFCNPPESYVITSGDMISKSVVWGYFGLWNLEKALLVQEAKDLPKQEAINFMKQTLSYNEEQAQRVYGELSKLDTDNKVKQWIAPKPVYTEQGLCKPTAEKTKILCKINGYGSDEIFFEIDVTTKEVYSMYNKRIEKPKAILWTDETGFHEKIFPDGKMTGAVILLEEKGIYGIHLVEYPFHKSLFNKLMFLDGADLEHFKLFDKEKSLMEGKIRVWKVDW